MTDAEAETEAASDGDEVGAETGTETEMETQTDGGDRLAPHTVRLELADEPGELLAALRPIADNGGNLLSIFHERGNVTPRGRIPVEVDLECAPDQFETIVEALREEGVNVIQAGAEFYSEEVTAVLVGHVVDTDISDTLDRIEENANVSLTDLSLSAPQGTHDVSSARLRLATREGRTDDALAVVREIADDKGLNVIEPLTEVSA